MQYSHIHQITLHTFILLMLLFSTDIDLDLPNGLATLDELIGRRHPTSPQPTSFEQ